MEGARITSKFQKICVYCGSSAGKRDCYKEAAKELAQEIITRNIDLVYGGGSIGLMGEISRAVHEGGCHVMGIIPSALSPKEITGETIGELKIVKNMHERKAEMAKHADCFIALPGGYGTMEELFEILTWAKLGIHHKPIGLLNVNGYYNNLLSFIERAVEDEFISTLEQNLFVHASNAKELMQKLEEFVPSKSETSKDE